MTLPETVHPCAPETADRALLQREACAPLYALPASLDAPTRAVLILRCTATLTLAQIGMVPGQSAEAMRTQITRALHT